jgi:hypothetical protein
VLARPLGAGSLPLTRGGRRFCYGPDKSYSDVILRLVEIEAKG